MIFEEKSTLEAVKIPIIAEGGASKLDDFIRVVLEDHASEVTAASIYHYINYTPICSKGRLVKRAYPVRLYPDETYKLTSL